MFLDTVNNFPDAPSMLQRSVFKEQPIFAPWLHFPHSAISHHRSACCDGAKAWFSAMDFSLLVGASPLTGPRWVRARWDWGPSPHPVFWCEAMRAKQLDCGALAALAHEAFALRGVVSYPMQLIQQFNADAAVHWREKWADGNASDHWITEGIFYHEGCAVQTADGTIRLWDATDAWWIEERQEGGYGSIRALRIHAEGAERGAAFRWGGRTIAANEWVEPEQWLYNP